MTEFDDVVARVFLERVSSLVETLRKSGVKDVEKIVRQSLVVAAEVSLPRKVVMLL